MVSFGSLICYLAISFGACACFAKDDGDQLPEPTDEQRSVLEADPAIKNAESIFLAEITAAESAFVSAKQRAVAKRLAMYRDKLKAFTKAGEFDKAIACKAAILRLEEADDAVGSPKPAGTIRHNGHTYLLVKDSVTWDTAKKRCELMGGHLITLEGNDEIDWFRRVCQTNKTSCWIGASDEESEGKWQWVNGRDVSSRIIKTAVLNNHNNAEHWLHFQLDDSRWHDSAQRTPFMCEWDH